MLEENPKDVLDRSDIARRESMVRPVGKKRHWLFKLILILIVIGGVYYLYMNPDLIMGPVNKFFGRFS